MRDTHTSKQTNKRSARIICTVFLEYFQPQAIKRSDAQVLEYNKKLNGTLSGTKNLAQQDIQTPSHFLNEEIVETMSTTRQHSISPIHHTLT